MWALALLCMALYTLFRCAGVRAGQFDTQYTVAIAGTERATGQCPLANAVHTPIR